MNDSEFAHVSPVTALQSLIVTGGIDTIENFPRVCLAQFSELSDPMDDDAFFDACVEIGNAYNVHLRRRPYSVPVLGGFYTAYKYHAELKS